MRTAADRVRLHPSWKPRLLPIFERPEMVALREFLAAERRAGKEIYPPAPLIFNALDLTPYEEVRVVILGQDPYHGPGQAHGLSFSVLPPVPPPPSLENIFKEIAEDLGHPRPDHGCLEPWARQGVLLLNTVLTVAEGVPQSHKDQGWEVFADAVLAELNQHPEGLVFLLWGRLAQEKRRLIDEQRHLVLQAVHPSPLSAHRGFFGCRHFSRANAWLAERGRAPVDWLLPPAAWLKPS